VDVKAAVEKIMNVHVDTKDEATAELAGASLVRYSSADGTYVLELDFAEQPVMTSTAIYDEYVLPSTDYVVTGTLVGVADSSTTTVSVTTTGTLDVDGRPIKTLEYDLLIVGSVDDGTWVTATVTGSVTANGTEFDVADWALGNLHIANCNALLPFIMEVMGW
ncbi:MAG: hypothetical protein KAU31_09025, partial [Spirochaetaceae bacterium]|nr:hypothetical protein [Spirochaetaceae bacterium]